jgi:uncharacterized DUF497 family protein
MEPERFDWDPAKKASNVRKHGITFEEATEVFDDPRRIEWPASDPADDEERFTTVGLVRMRILAIVYTERGQLIRVISARKASRDERRRYDQSKAYR